MKISGEEVRHVAKLARLDMDETAIEKFAEQIGSILGYADKLREVDTEGVRPTSHAIFLNNAFREDKVKEQLDRESALANAPEQEDGAFTVPRVLG
ncbi:MAG: Asp-tRNA(Asn)/Glu-tRNA(Gln) amidotransferase subunit GatC [Desulfococcaceae bacterium]|jgi:aspartyl-tRNA(Asn)/glutamyl-tRNA(Gln) amidotransferase subunit C|nr:Asp-tRNA(Asn)/Glu-tRNA(Gln) amidotransferase subunit GatC [Desulfococcaceae bacterium]